MSTDAETRTGSTTEGEWVVQGPQARRRTPAAQARRDLILRISLGALIPVLAVVSWELSARLGWIDARFFSQPSAVLDRFLADSASGLVWTETRITTVRLLTGYALGSVAGIVVGLALSQFTFLRWLIEPLIRALYVIPKLAILPLLLLLFGLGETPKLIFISLGTFYIVAFTTLSAAMMIPTPLHEAARSYGLSWSQRFRWLIIPASLPQIVSSLRLASGISMLLAIAVEFVNAQEGLGYYTWHAWELFVPERMYVGVVLISILGVVFSAVIGFLGSRLVRWSEGEFDQTR
ncbi:ABC transporter permease [Amycolatopsis sp. WAC 04197]|uniref:ABC transporter permease n=1 Tax=Amycolatopsis sp. WAC 04197 TaxID=2203199 RepID=UPI0013158DBA|nr:ABC transporter permease [Amycolatopsis sp. WAC 04197]